MSYSTEGDRREEPHTGCLAITGAASGIGRAVALATARPGSTLGIFDLSLDRAESVADEIRIAGTECVPFACDVREPETIRKAFDALEAIGGPLTGLVCSAGIERQAPLHETDDATWNDVIGTNLYGTFASCREALQRFLSEPARGGSIVCLSSPLGVQALPRASAYGASKAGVLAIVRGIAVEYGHAGIRANAVIPGATETPLMWSNVPPEDVDRTRTELERTIAIGRLAQPVDIAKVVAWLLSDEAAYITGAEVVCDGGILARIAIDA